MCFFILLDFHFFSPDHTRMILICVLLLIKLACSEIFMAIPYWRISSFMRLRSVGTNLPSTSLFTSFLYTTRIAVIIYWSCLLIWIRGDTSFFWKCLLSRISPTILDTIFFLYNTPTPLSIRSFTMGRIL